MVLFSIDDINNLCLFSNVWMFIMHYIAMECAILKQGACYWIEPVWNQTVANILIKQIMKWWQRRLQDLRDDIDK